MLFTSSAWSVAVIASRESLCVLDGCIRAALAACAGREAVIDILINGNPDLAHSAAAHAGVWQTPGIQVNVWSLRQGDKAHAWNEYVHRIWTPGTTAFFLDAYAQARPDAFVKLEAALEQHGVLGATGVPTSGRSASQLRAQMLREGGFHGNMHVIGAPAMAKLRASGFRLPLGLYRTDSLIGAVLMFNLNPAVCGWEPRRIAVAEDATWDVPGLGDLTLKNVIGQIKRTVRQARGQIENRAAREHLAVRKLAPQQMPRTIEELTLAWLEEQPQQARSLFLRQPLCLYAARQLRAPRDWSAATLAPECLARIAPASQTLAS